MSPAKKGALLIVEGMPPPDKLDKGKGGGSAKDEESDGEGEAAALVSAMGDFRSALKSGDDEAAAEAFVDLVKICRRY